MTLTVDNLIGSITLIETATPSTASNLETDLDDVDRPQ